LRYIGDLVQPQAAHLFFADLHQIDLLPRARGEHHTAMSLPVGKADDLENRLNQRRFARARFARDTNDLVLVNRQRGAIDNPGQAARRPEVDRQILDFEQGHVLLVSARHSLGPAFRWCVHNS
jgi:hypothetical protein